MHCQPCSTSADRSVSPDTPNSRQAIAPFARQKRVAVKQQVSPAPVWDTAALNPRESLELQQIFDIKKLDGVLPDPRELVDADGITNVLFSMKKSPSKLVAIIKRRISREKLRSSSSQQQRLWILRQPAEDREVDLDGFIERTPSLESFDPDAKILRASAASEGFLETSDDLSLEGLRQRKKSSSDDQGLSILLPVAISSGFELHNVSELFQSNQKLKNKTTSAIDLSIEDRERLYHEDRCPVIQEQYMDASACEGSGERRVQSSNYSPFGSEWLCQSTVSDDKLLHGTSSGRHSRDQHGPTDIKHIQASQECQQYFDGMLDLVSPGASVLSESESPFDDQISARTMSATVSSDASLHLQNMRISQHLRTMSSFSNGSIFSCTTGPETGPMLRNPFDNIDPSFDHRRSTSNPASILLNSAVPARPVSHEDRDVVQTNPAHVDSSDTQDTARSSNYKGVLSGGSTLAIPISVPMNEEKIEVLDTCGHEPSGLGSHFDAQQFPDNFSGHEFVGGNERNACYRPTVDSSVTCGRLDTFDGPSDQTPTAPRSDAPRSSLACGRKESIAVNIDDTARMWSRAMTLHQERQLAAVTESRFSLSKTSFEWHRKPRKPSKDSDLDPLEAAGRRSSARVPQISLEPINVEHSFGMLSLPCRSSVSQSLDHRDSARDFVSQGQSAGTDHVNSFRDSEVASFVERRRSTSEPPPSCTLRSTDSAQMTLTEHEPLSKPMTRLTAQRQSHISLGAWNRYPSYNREERNGPAGLSENVIVRDFAPVLAAAAIDTGNGTDSDDTTKCLDGKRKRKAAKLRRLIWHAKLLPGWPARFVQRNSDFYQRETGHRTSITMGGVLEYPELELLPGREARLAPDWNESFSTDYADKKRRSRSLSERGHNRRTRDTGTSSSRDSLSEGRKASYSEGEGRDSRPNAGTRWAAKLGHANHFRRRDTELVSPLDGHTPFHDIPGDKLALDFSPPNLPSPSAGNHSIAIPTVRRRTQPQIIVQPPTPITSISAFPSMTTAVDTRQVSGPNFAFRETVTSVDGKRPKLCVVASADEMRKSTKDLRELLLGREMSEADRAVDAAGKWDR